MRIQASREFSTWFKNVKEEGGKSYSLAAALLTVLRDLPAKPTEETATLKLVRQARRHRIWRIAHPFDSEVAVRILCWFPDEMAAAVALIGGNKAGISDIWYDSATPRAEAAVDQWKRKHEIKEQR